MVLTSVEDPRNPTDALTIRGTGSSSTSSGNTKYVSSIEFGQVVTWTDDTGTPGSGTVYGHTFAVVYVNDVVAEIPDANDHTKDVHASFLIFDLTAALASGWTDIPVDPMNRNITIGSTTNRAIYLGYIRLDDYMYAARSAGITTGLYSMTVEPLRGILVASPKHPAYVSATSVSGSYVELFDLREIASDANAFLSSCTDPCTAFVDLSRISTSVGGPPIDISHIPVADDDGWWQPRDIHAEYVNETSTRLYVATTLQEDFNGDEWYTENEFGGAAEAIVVSYPTKTSETFTYSSNWQYQFAADRGYATSRHSSMHQPNIASSQSTDCGLAWEYSNVSTFAPIVVGGNHYFLTANEFIPHLLSEMPISGIWTNGAFNYAHCAADASDISVYDDRAYASYLKLWHATEITENSQTAYVIQGLGYPEGPISSYDAPEHVAGSAWYGSSVSKNFDIAPTDADANNSAKLNVAPNTIHRVSVCDGTSDVLLASNSQGVRIVGLDRIPAQDGDGTNSWDSVREKAFFDWVPTLNYKGSTTIASCDDYFYLTSRSNANSSSSHVLPDYAPNCFLGTRDVCADVSHRTHSDENFVYAAGIGEQGSSSTSEPDNWLTDGGVLVLRYFNDEIGGIISGYTGTNTGSDRSYRTVNLQGKFTATRSDDDPSQYSTTIAEGATVNLLSGTTPDPTALLAPSGTTRTLMVYGTLNVYSKNGDLAYTASSNTGGDVITMNIIVSSTGTVNVKTGADARFAGNITVQGGGHLNVEAGATMRLGNHVYKCDGNISVLGTSTTSLARIRSYEGVATLFVGSRTSSNAQLSVNYAEIDSAQFVVQKVSGGYITNSIFKAYAGSIPTYACIAMYNLAHTLDISNNAFTERYTSSPNTVSQSDTAIALRDNVGFIETISQNTIDGFHTGVSLVQGFATVSSNSITRCLDGVNCQMVTRTTRIETNNIQNSSAAGVWCNFSNPFIVGNVISNNGTFGVFASTSSPFLGCNTISSNHVDGVNSAAPSFVNMGTDILSGFAAKNHVTDNYKSQLHIDGGPSITADKGHNYIGIENPNAGHPWQCGPGYNGALIYAGALAPAGPILATLNYWGPTYNKSLPATPNPTWRFCPTNANVTWSILTTAPSACTSGDIAALGVANCSYWSGLYYAEAGHFPNTCDSLLARYNMEINCGECSNAIVDLEAAIAICDPSDAQELTNLLQKLLAMYADCNGRNPSGLASVGAWFAGYSVMTSHDANRIPAKWMQGMAYGNGQFFSAAISIYDSIATLNLAAPFDSASARNIAAMYQDMMNVEGDNSLDGFGKQVMEYKGRADMQPVGIDPLGLTASPNPFANQQVDVRYVLPVEDASDITLIKVVDVLGHDVTTLVHDVQVAGPHLVSFSGADLPAGQFIVAVMTHNHVSSRLIIRLK